MNLGSKIQLAIKIFVNNLNLDLVYLPCVSKIVAFIVKNIDTIIFWHVLLVGLISHM